MKILSVCCSGAGGSRFIKTSLIQRAVLTAGSGLVSIFDPSRDDMISAFGELTADQALPQIHRKMLADTEGNSILRDKPTVNSKILDINRLANLNENTFGKHYVEFLKRNDITPDSRKPVLFIEDPELAYVMKRYREIHDFTHCILDMKTNMLGEVTVKIFEAIQLGLPMVSSIFVLK
jgi:ubiquinone biosynthesis protein COQ4